MKREVKTEMKYEITFDSIEVGPKGFNKTSGSNFIGHYCKTYTGLTRRQWKAVEDLIKTLGKEVE